MRGQGGLVVSNADGGDALPRFPRFEIRSFFWCFVA